MRLVRRVRAQGPVLPKELGPPAEGARLARPHDDGHLEDQVAADNDAGRCQGGRRGHERGLGDVRHRPCRPPHIRNGVQGHRGGRRGGGTGGRRGDCAALEHAGRRSGWRQAAGRSAVPAEAVLRHELGDLRGPAPGTTVTLVNRRVTATPVDRVETGLTTDLCLKQDHCLFLLGFQSWNMP